MTLITALIALAAQDEEAVLVGRGIVEVLALAECLDPHEPTPSPVALASPARMLHYVALNVAPTLVEGRMT